MLSGMPFRACLFGCVATLVLLPDRRAYQSINVIQLTLLKQIYCSRLAPVRVCYNLATACHGHRPLFQILGAKVPKHLGAYTATFVV